VARAKDDSRPPPGLKLEMPKFKVKQARASWDIGRSACEGACLASGADTCFISAVLAHQHSLKVTPKKERVTLGNNLEAKLEWRVHGKILEWLMRGQVTFKVIDTLLTPFEVIIGRRFDGVVEGANGFS